MKNKRAIKVSAWALAIFINMVFVFAYLSIVGLDGGYQTQIEKGDEAIVAGNYDRAVKAYLKAVSIAPSTSTGYVRAADTYIKLNLPQDAIEIMETYIASSPRSVGSFEYLLTLYDTYGSAPEKQIAVLDQAAILFDDAGYANRSGELKLLLSAVPAPVPTPVPGVYKDTQTITFQGLAAGDVIYYTSNGDEPDTSSYKYNTERGISLKQGVNQLKFIRYNADGNASNVLSTVYYIGERMSDAVLATITSSSGNSVVTSGQTLYIGTDTIYTTKSGIYSNMYGLLTSDVAESLNYSGGYLYYVNTSDGDSLYRIRLTDQDRQQILSSKCGMVHLAGDYIIFENKSDGSALYTANLAGGNVTRLTKDRISMFTVFKGYIYCRNDSKSGSLYRFSLDGIESSQLTDSRVACINISDNFVYYINMNDDGKIYRISPTGTDASQVCPVEVSEFTLSGDYIFYRGVSKRGIFRCNLMGEDTMLLTSDDGARLSVAGNRLYFVNYSDGSALYSIGLGGGDKTLVG